MYRNPEGQPTIEEMLKVEAIAKAQPTPQNVAALATISQQRTTYYGKDYLIGFRIDDFTRSLR